ncbi:MAG: sulfur carrier protein ThiS [Bryobacteraceae bacterium]|nr:sulfur carrier protein ThiS [Bryobacteraceae bacterium]
MQIVLNGEPLTVPAGMVLTGLLESLGLAEDRVAVELDRRIVKRAEWAETVLHEGSVVEVVQFVGGG